MVIIYCQLLYEVGKRKNRNAFRNIFVKKHIFVNLKCEMGLNSSGYVYGI